MSETIGNSNDIQITIPSSGNTDWAADLRDLAFIKIIEHTHQESGTGNRLIGHLALNFSQSLLPHDTYLGGENASAIKVDIIKIGTDNMIDMGQAFKNDTWLRFRNAANSADVNALKLDAANGVNLGNSTSDLYLTGADINFAGQIQAAMLANDVYLQAQNVADTFPINLLKLNGTDNLEFDAEIELLKLVHDTWMEGRNAADDGEVNLIKLTTGDIITIGDSTTNVDFSSNGAIKLPVGTEAQQPGSATKGMIRFNEDSNKVEVYGDTWGDLGGGGGGALNFYEQGEADDHADSDTDFDEGNDTVFNNGGALQGVFSLSTTAADLIRGDSVFKYVAHATPATAVDDWIASEPVNMPPGYRGRFITVKLQYKYNGADGDIAWRIEALDGASAGILTQDGLTLSAHDNIDNTAKEFAFAFFCPLDCTQIKLGPQVVVAPPAGSEELLWTDVEVTPSIQINANMQSGPSEVVRGSTNLASPLQNTISQTGTYSNGTFTSKVKGLVHAMLWLDVGAGDTATKTLTIKLNGTDVCKTITRDADGGGSIDTMTGVTFSGLINIGDTIAIAGTTKTHYSILVTPESVPAVIVESGDSIMTDWRDFTPTGSFVTNTTYTGKWRRVGSDMEVEYHLAFSGTPNSVSLTLDLPSGYLIDTDKTVLDVAASDGVLGTGVVIDGGTTNYAIEAGFSDTSTISVHSKLAASAEVNFGGLTQAVPISLVSTDAILLKAKFPISGWSSLISPLIGMPRPKFQRKTGSSGSFSGLKIGNVYTLSYSAQCATNSGQTSTFTITHTGTTFLQSRADNGGASGHDRQISRTRTFVATATSLSWASGGTGGTFEQEIILREEPFGEETTDFT